MQSPCIKSSVIFPPHSGWNPNSLACHDAALAPLVLLICYLSLAHSGCSDHLGLLAGTHGSPDLTCFPSQPTIRHLDKFPVELWDSALGSGPPPSNMFPKSPPVYMTFIVHLVLHWNHLCHPRDDPWGLGNFSTSFSKSREIQSTLRDRVRGLQQTNPSVTFFSSSKFHILNSQGKKKRLM